MKINRFLSILALAFPVSVFALDVNDEASYQVDIPQTLAISSPSDATSGVSGTAQSIQWTVDSNNGVRINFTGSAFSDAGDALAYPIFIKEDKNAAGSSIVVDSKTLHDHLDTLFGIVISGHESVQTGASWGSGASATSSPSHLVLGLGETSSPDASFGRIMPSDDGSSFNITLYAVGSSDAYDQSGDYSLSVTAVATGYEV